MKIHFNGAAQTVTGSQYYLEINGQNLLLECGLFQGRRKDYFERNQNFLFDPRKLDAVILSHAHIDHSGNLPNLVCRGYSGPIYTTSATAKLSDVMLKDSGHIQEADAEFINKKRLKRGEAPIRPLYTTADAEQVYPLFRQVAYGKVFEAVPGVYARLIDAGHILGSAAISLDIDEHGHKYRLWFSGDIGRPKLPLIPDPVFPEGVDYLMMECTYGDKPHRDPQEAYVEFRDTVRRTIRRRGKVIIPAFAVGRTQELVYDLNRMITGGEIPAIPVYVDSPLAVKATEVFRQCPEYYDDETRQFISTGRHPALMFDGLTYISDVYDSKKLNDRDDPMIIISASGMAETGRILHHLKNNIENERNTICIVSWQAPDTLGRRLADRDRWVNIFGEEYECKAEVVTIGGLSAHAGQDVLLDYAKSVKSHVKQIFLVHGEPKSAVPFNQLLSDSGINSIHYPEQFEQAEIEV